MFWSLALMGVGLIGLLFGADRFVFGAAAIARSLGIAPILVGLTIVALGTSGPEILVCFVAAMHGETDLAIGNVIGSNIINIGLVLGVVAVIRPIKVGSTAMRGEMPILLAVTLLSVSLFFDSDLSRIDGAVLIFGLMIFIFWLLQLGRRSSVRDTVLAEYDAQVPRDATITGAFLWTAFGLTALLFGAELVVDGSTQVARSLGISEIVVGIVIVALGTSLPELAVSVVSATKGEYELALGNIAGSNIFNSLAALGLAAIIDPADVPQSVQSLHLVTMVAFTLALFLVTCGFSGKQDISRSTGATLLLAFVMYEFYTLLTEYGR